MYTPIQITQKTFEDIRMLSFNKVSKIILNSKKIRMILHKINSTIINVFINKGNIITGLLVVVVGKGPHISE